MRLIGMLALPVSMFAMPLCAAAQYTTSAAGPSRGCAPIVVRVAGADSAANALLRGELTASLLRHFHPLAATDSGARLVLTVDADDIHARTAGLYDPRIPPAVRIAVAGARNDVSRFRARPGAGAPVEFVASFEPACVREFPPAEPASTQGAYFEFQVDVPVRPLSGDAPQYPAALRERSVSGRVLAQFVVDAMGVPEMQTFKILESSNELFSQAVRAAVPAMRFAPAMVGGRRVPQVVQQPFTFAM